MDEDDIYGEDIYGGTAFDRDGDGTREPINSLPGALTLQSGSGTEILGAEILALEKQLRDKDIRNVELEAQLNAALSTIKEWRSAFREASSGSLDAKAVLEPATAAAELKRLRASLEKQQPAEDLSTFRQREAALQMQLAERNLENIELRRQAHTARQYADPDIAQVRQLLLDPAVEKEFDHMREELEAKARELKGVQEELQAVQFSQDSKAGRMLMAKCRALQDENEEMGRDLAEGKVHALERQVALSKAYVEDMRARYLELEDHLHALDTENEDVHQQVFMLKRQLREAEVRSVSTGRERPLRSMQSGGPKFSGQGGFGMGGHSLPGPPGGGGPSPHGQSMGGKFDSPGLHSPDGDRKRGFPMRDGNDRFGNNKRMR